MGSYCLLLIAVACFLYAPSKAWSLVITPSAWMKQERTIGGRGFWEPMRRSRVPRFEITTMMSRSSLFRGNGESKRQARFSQLMTSELAVILRCASGIRTNDKIADSILAKISVVDVDISPDLRSANVLISVYGSVLEKREAYAWCVKNTKSIRMALASNLRGMKRVPELYFKDTDIGAAVDLMALIDRVSSEDEANAMARGDKMPGSSEEDSFTFDFDEDYDEDYDVED